MAPQYASKELTPWCQATAQQHSVCRIDTFVGGAYEFNQSAQRPRLTRVKMIIMKISAFPEVAHTWAGIVATSNFHRVYGNLVSPKSGTRSIIINANFILLPGFVYNPPGWAYCDWTRANMITAHWITRLWRMIDAYIKLPPDVKQFTCR